MKSASLLKWLLIISSVAVMAIDIFILIADIQDVSKYEERKMAALRDQQNGTKKEDDILRRRFEPSLPSSLLMALMLLGAGGFTLIYFYYWPQMHFIALSFLTLILYLIVRYIFCWEYNFKLVFVVILYAGLEAFVVFRFMASSNDIVQRRTLGRTSRSLKSVRSLKSHSRSRKSKSNKRQRSGTPLELSVNTTNKRSPRKSLPSDSFYDKDPSGKGSDKSLKQSH